MSSVVPKSAPHLLELVLDTVRIRANANGECFGGEIAEALRDAGAKLGVDRLDVLLIRTALARTMESLGESYPTEVLQNFEIRMPVSRALTYLNEAIISVKMEQEEEHRLLKGEDFGATRVSRCFPCGRL